MTEIPEHLLKRSRERRAALGLPTDGGEGTPAEGGGATPAAAVTGHSDPADRARVLRAGFQAHLPKRALPEGLIGTVASLATRAVGVGGAPS